MDPMKDRRPHVTAETWTKPVLCPLPDWLLPAMGYTVCNGEAGNGHAEPEAVIRQGKRDVTLTSMAGTMRNKGFSEAAILSALLVENETRCIPCLSTDQVEKIAHSVARYEPDPFAHITFKNVTAAGANGHAANGHSETAAETAEIVRILASQLKAAEHKDEWIWNGYMARGGITLFSALWKAGKTTLLAHLLASFGQDETFCGQAVRPARVVYVTEESQALWAGRRDKVGFGDWCEFVIRPFNQKPSFNQWYAFLNALAESLRQRPADLVVFDPITNLWPVKDENSAAEVTTALMPLRTLDPNECRNLTLVHHLRKGDGLEATGSRGSGALTGFVDTIVELRRFQAADNKDRRRVLTAHGRYDDTPAEAVVELTDHGYALHGTRSEVASVDAMQVLMQILPPSAPGLTQKDLYEKWPEGSKPNRNRFLDALRHGVNVGFWRMGGSGNRGDPIRYYLAPK
jgi:hypothetical protein